MPIKYKFDVLEALKVAGFTTYRIRKEKLLAETTVQKLRNGVMVDTKNIGVLCELLDCQPGDLIEYIKEKDESANV